MKHDIIPLLYKPIKSNKENIHFIVMLRRGIMTDLYVTQTTKILTKYELILIVAMIHSIDIKCTK